MAARLRKHHQAEIRDKIRASQLVNRLENHAFDKVEMSQTQVQAVRILLGKVLPDLSAVTLGGDPERPVILQWQTKQT